MRKRLFGYLFFFVAAMCASSGPLCAQTLLPAEVARFGYPDTIFTNGKVVSMDDHSTSTQVGHIYQALAIKGDKIMKLGTVDEVKALAGPDTKTYDLKGREMLPGIVEPHNHIYGGAAGLLPRLPLHS